MFSLLDLGEIASWDRFELEAVCRAQAQSAYLGDHESLCRVLGRYKFYVDTRDSGFASNVLLDGFWEMWLTQFIARRVKPGMVVADIGANFGYYTLLLADLVGPDGHVFSVEPNPVAVSALRRSVVLNGFAERTSIVAAAAGDVDGGELLLFVPDGEPKNATVIADAKQVVGLRGTVHRVPRKTIDSISAAKGSLDFLKIDAEGAEEQIIRGMSDTLEKRRPEMVLEFNAARYANPGQFLSSLTDIYGAIKYVDYYGNLVSVSSTAVLEERYGQDWLLFFGGE